MRADDAGGSPMELEPNLARLLDMFDVPPGDAVILERGREDWGQEPWSVERTRLESPADYAPRFTELMKRGFGWLNLSYYGQLEGRPLVVVEVPAESESGKADWTSVNLSGPSRAVQHAGGDVGVVVTLFPEG